MVASACTGGGRVPDQPCCLQHPAPTVTQVGADDWTQPPLGEGLGPDRVDARARIRELRDGGHTWGSVAAVLNAEGVATPSGQGHWHRSTVEHYADPAAWAAEQARRRARRG